MGSDAAAIRIAKNRGCRGLARRGGGAPRCPAGRRENRAADPAFTLVELLVAVAIIGLLVALLLPAAATAWDVALMTQCRANLNRLWQAQNLWRADSGSTTFTVGGVWPAMLAPYVDGDRAVFRCPVGPTRPWWDGIPDTEPADGTSAADPGSDASEGGPEPQGFTVHDLTFRIYCRQAFKPYKTGQYLGTAFADAAYGVRKQDLGGDKWSYGIDDRSFFFDQSANPGNLDYADIRFNLQMHKGRIISMEFLGSDDIVAGQGSYRSFRFEVWLDDEVISDDFVRDQGRVTALEDSGGGSAASWSVPGYGTAPGTAGGQGPKAGLFTCIKSFDYGVSKGVYETGGARVANVDPGQVFILDYGKSVANYAGANPDVWEMYFLPDKRAWMDKFAGRLRQGETWEHYRALRHFGKANVLYCDGHVDILAADELNELAPLWRYSGR
jgi:prepilin-type processing-associated H-X9-DG protein/prepilin-type N-terminal cleavage/methylation domain-containing protein